MRNLKFVLGLVFLLTSILFSQQNQYVIDLDGTESFFVRNDDAGHLDVSNSYTFECWIYLKSYQQYDRIMDRRYVFAFDIIAPKGSGDYGIRFTKRDNNHNIVKTIETNEADEDLYLNTWYHVAVTFDGSVCRLYVNDNLVGLYSSTGWDLSSSSTALNIGGLWNSGYYNQINAYIDEVRVSDIARSINEMQTSLNSPEYSVDNHTVLLMHLDDQADPPSYESGTGLSSTTGDDDITASDYVAYNDPVFGGSDLSLPVELTSFTASVEDGAVQLNWVTESEVNNQGFEIWRALGKEGTYQRIADYTTHPELKGQGNSTLRHEYHYTDQTVTSGHVYWYKLADVDVSGKRTFHGPISVSIYQGNLTTISSNIPRTVHLYPNFPNPFNPSTTLKFDIPLLTEGPAEVQLAIYNSLGQKVATLFHGFLNAGTYQVQWDGKDARGNKVQSGIYFAMLQTPFNHYTIKLLLTK